MSDGGASSDVSYLASGYKFVAHGELGFLAAAALACVLATVFPAAPPEIGIIRAVTTE
ncbi:hypothetical protein [Actinomadura sp. 7K507]|uniref:hypothetical protein n=1 Tax=Actinomadura sp. 7K507 TaxID=2530365 RepID=UPI0014054DAA|nr:hypothetical protein [Actinomadura sp. 7K507]